MTDVSALGYIAKSAARKNLELTGQVSQPSGARKLGTAISRVMTGGITLTAAQCLSDFIEITGDAATVTLPTAASMIAAIDEVTDETMWVTYLMNNGGGTCVIGPNADGFFTEDGTPGIITNKLATLLFRVTDQTSDSPRVLCYVSYTA